MPATQLQVIWLPPGMPPKPGHLGLDWLVPSIPCSDLAPHERNRNRTENATFIFHNQLYKRNIPTRARVGGPFHERALEKASEEEGAAWWGVRRSQCFPLGTRAVPCSHRVPPGRPSRPTAGGDPTGRDTGQRGCPLCPLCLPRAGGQPSLKAQSGTWGGGGHWKLDTA